MTSVQGYLTQTLEGYTCMISPANFISHPAKVTRPTAFFLQKKTFLYNFRVSCRLVGQWVGIWIAVLKLNIYMCEY